MLKLFSSKKSPVKKQPIAVVSGLPRSGTSMMMKMLQAGGLEPLTDSIRSADDDNPNGYFEFERVKQMSAGDRKWLDEAGGKVVKVISYLLEQLPTDRMYKVIFMEREIREVLASQKKMLVNRGEESKISDAEMEAQFREHIKLVKPWLARQPHMEVLYVGYNSMMSDPNPLCNRIVEFLGMPLDLEKMRAVPNAKLYRNRA
ncbi:MAG: sulfotransferase family protein [Anaerolineaceae bacterium]|nr:MAG: sulfotransferase family protein [Anaerolineaceae bacterium]